MLRDPAHASPAELGSSERAFVDLHCHTSASFDSLANPRSVVRAAAARGLTHLAITDHDRIEGALRARDAAPAELTVIVGEECRTADGDLICLFLERAVAPGRPAAETIAEVREQGGLVGIPHPFDRFRSSILRDAGLLDLAGLVDWVETYNARLLGGGNDRAVEFARERRTGRGRRVGRPFGPGGRGGLFGDDGTARHPGRAAGRPPFGQGGPRSCVVRCAGAHAGRQGDPVGARQRSRAASPRRPEGGPAMSGPSGVDPEGLGPGVEPPTTTSRTRSC